MLDTEAAHRVEAGKVMSPMGVGEANGEMGEADAQAEARPQVH